MEIPDRILRGSATKSPYLIASSIVCLLDMEKGNYFYVLSAEC